MGTFYQAEAEQRVEDEAAQAVADDQKNAALLSELSNTSEGTDQAPGPILGGFNFSGVDFSTKTSKITPGQLVNGSSRDTQAALAREDWDDYKERFFPLENKLIDQYNNGERRSNAIAESGEAVNMAFDADAGVQQRRLSRYGTNLSADQQAASDRQNQISKTATLTDTRNLTRDSYADLDSQILSGTSSSSAQTAGGA